MSESNTENDGQAPEHPDADIIIRSSDGADYCAHALLFRLASPIFRDMFALPRPLGVDETKDGLPIVKLSESSRTIQILLSYCYPAVYRLDEGVKELSEVAALLEATRKYDMEMVHKAAVQLLSSSQFLEKEPLRVYAIACRYQLQPEARLAAHYTLRHPLLDDKYITELESIDAGKLYRVLMYHKKCEEVATAVAKDYTWITTEYAFFNCSNRSSEFKHIKITGYTKQGAFHHRRISRTVKVHLWWMEYMERTRIKLLSNVHGQTVRDVHIVNDAFAAAGSCTSCPLGIIENFRTFIDTYANEIERRISEV